MLIYLRHTQRMSHKRLQLEDVTVVLRKLLCFQMMQYYTTGKSKHQCTHYVCVTSSPSKLGSVFFCSVKPQYLGVKCCLSTRSPRLMHPQWLSGFSMFLLLNQSSNNELRVPMEGNPCLCQGISSSFVFPKAPGRFSLLLSGQCGLVPSWLGWGSLQELSQKQAWPILPPKQGRKEGQSL